MNTKKVVILVTGAVVLAAMIAGGALRSWVRRSREADLRSAPTQIGMATVAALSSGGRSYVGREIEPLAVVRFRGRLYKAAETLRPEGMAVGGPVRIAYRIGRSGTLYIDIAEPLPPPRSGSQNNRPSEK